MNEKSFPIKIGKLFFCPEGLQNDPLLLPNLPFLSITDTFSLTLFPKSTALRPQREKQYQNLFQRLGEAPSPSGHRFAIEIKKKVDRRRVCNFLWAARSRLIDVGGDSVTK